MPQGTALGDFQLASEFGVPVGMRSEPNWLTVGAKLNFYDAATRFTHVFLRESTAAQIEAVTAGALEADNRLVYSRVMQSLLVNTRRANENGTTVYPLYAGQADDIPPEYLGMTFAGSHQHYLAFNGVFDAVDLEDLIRHIAHHGVPTGAKVIVLANPAEAETIRSFRAGIGAAKTDFIPGLAASAFLTTSQIVGSQAPASYDGMPLIGSFGDAYVASEPFVPTGYVVAVLSGGAGSAYNPVALRSHSRQEYRGLRLVKGLDRDYPLMGSYWSHGVGAGVRRRGAAAVMQVTANATYTPPATLVNLP